tara:strand:- start:5 stop:481 length:477 start_codon:yes stop_codon:yes gene_type:complete
MYNPLPPRLTIKHSLISGLGLFATAGIAQGTNLGTTHIKVDDTIFRTPLGGFINCDENANCVKVEMRTEGSITDKWNLVTLRNITNEEELTLKYTFYTIEKDFLEEAEKEKKELEESYQESKRQTEERKAKERLTNPLDSFSEDLQKSIKESRRQTNS